MSDSSETIRLLRRLVRAAEREDMGLRSDPPGTVTLYANRVKAPDNCCWYRWDPNAEEPIAVTDRYVRGRLSDIVCYDKESSEGTTTKLRVALDAGRTQYDIETSLAATSGRGVVSGLLAAGKNEIDRPITIGVEPADKDQVLFMSVFTDAGGKQYPDSTPSEKDALVSGLKTIREWMGLSSGPWTERFTRSAPHEASQEQPPPRGDTPAGDGAHEPAVPEASATTQAAKGSSNEEGGLTELSPKARKTLERWDEALSQKDGAELADAVEKCRDQIQSWPPAYKEKAKRMLGRHDRRAFEADEELPF